MVEPPRDIVDLYSSRTTTVEVAADECDECPALAHVAAYVYADLPSGRTIAYCGHHGTIHLTALHAIGATVIDLRHLIGP